MVFYMFYCVSWFHKALTMLSHLTNVTIIDSVGCVCTSVFTHVPKGVIKTVDRFKPNNRIMNKAISFS